MGRPHSFKLTYFDLPARCEPIRILFHYLNQDFEDVRVTSEYFSPLLIETLMEQLPILEIDGGRKTIPQSFAIMRYLAKTLGAEGFAGKTKTDSAMVDAFVYACHDLYSPIALYTQAIAGKAEIISVEGTTKLFTESTQRFLRSVEKQLKSHGLDYIVQYITWADIIVMYMLYKLEQNASTIIVLLQYPLTLQYYKRMRELDEIKDYVAKNLPQK
ncbi:hypothetical protein PENTCL1PPCAC_15765, partial [Pristionchus entomophagus]